MELGRFGLTSVLQSGVLEDVGGHTDDIREELDEAAAAVGVDSQLAGLKANLAASPAPPQTGPRRITADQPLQGCEPLTFCMPCSRVSSDSVALGLITALQSNSDVWGRLAQSSGIWGHTGRPPARCLWVRSFSGGPRSEPDGRLSAHPALQRSSRAVRGWLPRAAGTQDSLVVAIGAYYLSSGLG